MSTFTTSILMLTARNVIQNHYQTDEHYTHVSVDEALLDGKLVCYQITDKSFGRVTYNVAKQLHMAGPNQVLFNLHRRCSNKANLLVTVGAVVQSNSFKLYNDGAQILFSEPPKEGNIVVITELQSTSPINGPFESEDYSFMSTGGSTYRLKSIVDFPDSVLAFVGQVPQSDFTVGPDRKTVIFDVNIPEGLKVFVKHIHQRCFKSPVAINL